MGNDPIFDRAKSSSLRIPPPAAGITSSAGVATMPAPNARAKQPRFLVPPEHSFEGWWDSLVLIFSRLGASTSRRTVYLVRHGTLARTQSSGKTLGASFA